MRGGGSGVAAVVGVVGAVGGAGASVCAAGLARAAHRDGDHVVLVDLETRGGGPDVLLGIEPEPGLRWADLHGARGTLDGAALVARLPAWCDVPVLGAARDRPEAIDPQVVVDVCAAVADACDLLVLDLPRWVATQPRDLGAAVLGACDALVLVTPLDLPGVAGALAARYVLTETGARHLALVTRGPAPGRLSPWEVSDAVGLPLAAAVRWDPRLAGAVERGEGPPSGARSALGRAGRELASWVRSPGAAR
ncbi:septum site-determining protein Ssd [Oerskovia flava]|uniref:septum site-determining protein Ssd n=1 Tax=Oerskovia flava TaxID=2986422 RepID=UPI00223EE4CE|nr:septum site-determining protein Ssd [Oerskovia sp. JB1-3-2]